MAVRDSLADRVHYIINCSIRCRESSLLEVIIALLRDFLFGIDYELDNLILFVIRLRIRLSTSVREKYNLPPVGLE